MITIKEEFVGGTKITRAIEIGGWPALGLWLAMKCYAAENLTDGFVPDEVIDKLRGAPRGPRKLLPALVECGSLKPDGSRKSGLVDQHPHGWQLHDYLDHANSAEQEHERRRKERDRKAAYRAGQKTGQSTRDTTRDTGTSRPSVPQDVPRDTHAEAHAPTRVSARPRAPSPAQPSPAQPAAAEAAAAARPQNQTEAMLLPIGPRAGFVERDRHLADWVVPHTWPEVVAVANALHQATGAQGQARLAAYSRDAGVRAIVTLFAAGFSQNELESVAASIVQSAWWNEGGRKGLAALTVEVARRELAEAPHAPSGVVRKAPSIAERQQAEFDRIAADARAHGVETPAGEPVTDLAELDRILASVGGGIG